MRLKVIWLGTLGEFLAKLLAIQINEVIQIFFIKHKKAHSFLQSLRILRYQILEEDVLKEKGLLNWILLGLKLHKLGGLE